MRSSLSWALLQRKQGFHEEHTPQRRRWRPLVAALAG
jgi:hypothetical protein